MHALNGLDFLLVHFNATVLDNEAEELSRGDAKRTLQRVHLEVVLSQPFEHYSQILQVI